MTTASHAILGFRKGGAVARKSTHKWAFKPGMRAGAFGWRGSAKAIDRLKSASAEIRSVRRSDPVMAAEGVVALAERIWPAFEHIDTSSGALGTAVHRTQETLLPVLIEASAGAVRRALARVPRLLEAIRATWVFGHLYWTWPRLQPKRKLVGHASRPLFSLIQ
jgi:hypothetical protein